ncbi:recombinase family protein [Pontibacillus yanchengensis]|uniref:Recombinase family protein n=1 Tax=Pontibacillus yanchengensis TaxID=462910 RepID=A0A6I5A2Z6_9BACI|nr:recombinase family protein [Pontibacillus yanchengensis]MYL33251.1 recombinase family protein [Pontibacillus yanchengensis]
MKVGYVRVSSNQQNVERQVNKMLEIGVQERFLFIDKVSGKDFERDMYKAMINVLREGDIVYIDALDRLGRTYDGIIKEWKYITRDINADIVVIENSDLFDSRKFKEMGDMGKLMEDQFLSLLSYVADQERKKILQRQKEGIDEAKKNGKHLGRPSINLETLNDEQKRILEEKYEVWKNKEITGVEFMSKLALKKNTFYKIIKKYAEIKNS